MTPSVVSSILSTYPSGVGEGIYGRVEVEEVVEYQTNVELLIHILTDNHSEIT